MAKKRVHPESFRVSTTQGWESSLKLVNYSTQIRLKQILDLYFNTYFDTLKHDRKLLLKTQRRSLRLISNIRRRSILATNMIFSKNIKFPNYLPFDDTNYNILPYWYTRSSVVMVNQKLQKFDTQLVQTEKEIQKRRNLLLYRTLKLQRYIPYSLFNMFFYLTSGLGGSTALRRYQFNLIEIQPAQWTLFLNLTRHSFKKMVGYITSTPRVKQYGGQYVLLLSQLNIALHWKSSYLFVSVLKTAIEQKKRAPGFLRVFQATLVRLQINRYNITTIVVMVTGSFGKMSRTRVLRLGQSPHSVTHSLTTLTQPVSYAIDQAQTLRGTLGLRVWLFWQF